MNSLTHTIETVKSWFAPKPITKVRKRRDTTPITPEMITFVLERAEYAETRGELTRAFNLHFNCNKSISVVSKLLKSPTGPTDASENTDV